MNTLPDPQHPFTPLAIVGLGCLFPKADGLGGYWANIKHAVDCITDVPTDTHWNPADYFDPDPKKPDMTYAARGGFLTPIAFNPMEFGIPPRDIEATDTSQLLGLVAAKRALDDSGITLRNPNEDGGPKSVDRNRASVILGVTGTLELVVPLGARLGHPKWKQAMKDAGIPDDLAADAAQRIGESYVPWQENSFPGLLGNVVAGRIANRLDLGGTNCVVDAACASSLSAVHLAALELQAGRSDVVVTGGVDTFNDIFMFMCFSKTPALSKGGNAKPFDADGDGTILGEGLGMVVLKRLADAERDGDTVYAVIKSIGSSSDGKGNAIYAPSAAGQQKALRTAYKLAGVTPDTIELLEGHGTGTKVGDATEVTALAEVFNRESNPNTNKPRPWCAIGSVKSQIGHTKAAAGAASLIKATLAVYYKVLPPTVKVSQPVEPLRTADSPFYVNTRMRPWLPRAEHPRRAALSAFGFGGSNFHAVLEEHRPEKSEVDWDGSVELMTLSGASAKEIASKLPGVTDWPAFARAAEQSRATFDAAAPCRLVLVAHRDTAHLEKLLASAKANLASNPTAKFWQTPEGAYFGSGPVPGKLAVLFPGQGSQAVGMLRELACLFPEMIDSLAEANEAVARQRTDDSDDRRLSEAIYPPSTFQSGETARQDTALRATDTAQPAIGAVSFGAWRVLSERFGLAGDVFAGHSYGELVALAAAGSFTGRDLFSLSRVRGRLMAQQRVGDAGAMLAVFAPAADIQAAIDQGRLDVVVANRNAPQQSVLSGPTAEIGKAEELFAKRKIRCVKLPVAAAFHSPLVADAATPFQAALQGVSFRAPTKPVYANTTAAAYPNHPDGMRGLLANQLANPVNFVSQVRAMYDAGVRTFLEVGPGSVLTRLVDATLSEHAPPGEVAAFALDASAGKRSGVLDLGNALGRLVARGHSPNVSAWEAGSRCRPGPVEKPGLTVAICGANYVSPREKRAPRPVSDVRNGVAPPDKRRPTTSAGEPMTDPTHGHPATVTQAMQLTQQTLAALQQMQAQTAQLHRQFLESQEMAQRTLSQLVAQQQALLFPNAAPPTVAVPAPTAPAPAPVQQPQPPSPPVAVVAPAAPVVQSNAQTPSSAHAQTTRLSNVSTVRSVSESTLTPITPPHKTNGSAKGAAPAAVPAPSAEVESTLLAVVAEKTGYPVEMLKLDMALDTDLGIDSIKRVEILSALQERLPDAPVVRSEHLGTLHTLRDVAFFLTAGTDAAPAAGSLSGVVQLAPVRTPTSADSSSVLPFAAGVAGTSAAAAEEIRTTLLAVVAEKTGYPVEMLKLDMALDTDLGIDSIKRVEILSALQERLPDAPVVRSEHLGTLHTLKDVADFLIKGGQPSPATEKVDPGSILPVAQDKESAPVSTQKLTAIRGASRTPVPDPSVSELLAPKTEHLAHVKTVAENTGPRRNPKLTEPRPGGSPAISLDRVDRSILQVVDIDLQVARPRLSLPEGGLFWVVGDEDDALTREVQTQLTAQGFEVQLHPWTDPDDSDAGGSPAALVLIAPETVPAGLPLNRLAFRWLQNAATKLRHPGRPAVETLFATVARLDGEFGLGDLDPSTDPTPGGLAGLVKTVRHEWPEVGAKAIDVDPTFVTADPSDAAVAVVDELLTIGPVEVGIAAKHRCTVEMARTIRRQVASGAPVMTSKDVVLVTGGARGVTAEVAVTLAEVYTPTVVLTGRTPVPAGPEPDWLQGLAEEAEMKKAIADHLGDAASPKAVGEFYARVTAQREVARTMARIEKAGAKVAYYAVNVANGRQVSDLLHQVQIKFGPVTALVHGAGVLADRKIEALTTDQFDLVYSTKVDGLRNLLELLAHQELKSIILFSSTTARLGRTGQLAYACSNEVLNKTAAVEAKKRPNARVVSINWGPWEGGMVTPALRRVFESEGIGLIPMAEGGLFAVQELTAMGRAVEVVALGKLRVSKAPSETIRPHGMPSPAAAASGAAAAPPATNPPPPELAVAFELGIDVPSHPILKAHVLDGRAVVPMALHMEWLAHAALHGNPGLVFHGFNDLRITHGVMVEDGSATTVRALAGKAVKHDRFFHVPVELRGKRRDGRDTVHSRAEVILVAALPKPPMPEVQRPMQPYTHPIDEVYRYFLFHGPDLQGIEAVEGFSDTAFLGTAYPAPPPAEWFANPLRSAWVADPLVLDSSFQMMILWSFAQHGAGSLPCFAGRYRQYRRVFPTSPTRIAIRVTRDNGSFARADIDYLDAEGILIAQVQDYECVIDRQLDQAFRRNQLAPKANA